MNYNCGDIVILPFPLDHLIMEIKNLYRLIIPIILFLSLSCIRDKSVYPFGYEYYMQNWPPEIIAQGLGYPNLDLSPAGQRASALRAAKLNLYKNLCDSTFNLPIDSNKKLVNLFLYTENQPLKIEIETYIQSFRVIDTIYYSDGSVKVIGYIATTPLKEIIRKYVSSPNE